MGERALGPFASTSLVGPPRKVQGKPKPGAAAGRRPRSRCPVAHVWSQGKRAPRPTTHRPGDAAKSPGRPAAARPPPLGSNGTRGSRQPETGPSWRRLPKSRRPPARPLGPRQPLQPCPLAPQASGKVSRLADACRFQAVASLPASCLGAGQPARAPAGRLMDPCRAWLIDSRQARLAGEPPAGPTADGPTVQTDGKSWQTLGCRALGTSKSVVAATGKGSHGDGRHRPPRPCEFGIADSCQIRGPLAGRSHALGRPAAVATRPTPRAALRGAAAAQATHSRRRV